MVVLNQDACRKGGERNPAIAEHACSEHRPWQEAKILDRVVRVEDKGSSTHTVDIK